ncbi:MAG: helix-turn-helix domain-containing protein [Christensenellaceae bacterium]|jgi:DNA-binding helix-turn-helix protein
MVDIIALKKAKKEKNLTYEELSKISKIPLSTIYDIFRGVTTAPRIDTMQAIENALGITSQWTEEEIAQGAGIEPVALEQEELYWLDLLNRVKDKLGEKYLSAVLQMLEMTLQNK